MNEPQGVRCGECEGPCELVGGAAIYPHRPDLHHKRFWRCRECGAYCGCHPRSTRALGKPAGPKTRAARRRAHFFFDQLWKSGKMTRSEAYRWLRDATGLSADDCHIGQMTAEEADGVAELVREREK